MIMVSQYGRACEVSMQLLTVGRRPVHGQTEYHHIQYPSRGDHDVEIDHLKYETQACDREFEQLQKKKIKDEMGEATPVEKWTWEHLMARRDLLDTRLVIAGAVDLPDGPHFGNVIPGSGYRKAEGFALGWAVVEVATDRVGKE